MTILVLGVELFPIFGGNLDVTDSVDSFGYKKTEKVHPDVWKSKSASHIAFFDFTLFFCKKNTKS